MERTLPLEEGLPCKWPLRRPCCHQASWSCEQHWRLPPPLLQPARDVVGLQTLHQCPAGSWRAAPAAGAQAGAPRGLADSICRGWSGNEPTACDALHESCPSHPILYVLQGNAVRDYVALDASLVAWHASFGALVDRAASMAVVRRLPTAALSPACDGLRWMLHCSPAATQEQLHGPCSVPQLCLLPAGGTSRECPGAAALPPCCTPHQVGLMTDGDLGLELEFNAAAGSDKRALKSQL